ncbi:MAG TPA: DUF1858 domain-containing protein [Devosiaceae bacterium]
MARRREFSPYLSMDEIMRRWPQTLDIIIAHRMLCVGCPIAPFHDVFDACSEHRINEETLIGELAQATTAEDKER